MTRALALTKVALAAAAAAFLAAGCEFGSSEENEGTVTIGELQGQTPPPASGGDTGGDTGGGGGGGGTVDTSNLPTNPKVSGSWYFGYKSYDGTYRIRWPTYFATSMGFGPGSYTLVNGQKATFRSYDTDNGQKRPSYTISGPSSRFNGQALCVLVSASDQPVAWFTCNADATTSGSLP